MAAGVLAIDADPGLGRVLPRGTGDTLRALLEGAGPEAARILRRPHSPLRRRIEARLFPGAAEHFAVRKAWVDATVTEALTAGATQVLVIGAGFDPLAARLAPQWPGVTFVEVDQPQTSGAKAAGIDAAGLARPNLHLVGRDLSAAPLAEVLPDGWRRDALGVVVAEGLLMYLDEAAVAALLQGVTGIGAPGSRFAFTFIPARDDGRHPVPAVVRWVLAAVGEPLRWVVARGALEAAVHGQGHDLVDVPDGEALRARFLAAHGLADAPLDEREGFGVTRTRG